ncbi:MAG: FadR/GntR family transcriptional regulator [Clostridiales bacterium]|nr:FadR family transcriptional regulator [Clostridiales bacterium]MDD7348015.1 FadR/GntR family transcriptional regulator [Clostridiales bacterium]MDY4060707.1 FadR/GntR family transcriptional regulator [Anaerovoracaceae bacterium]
MSNNNIIDAKRSVIDDIQTKIMRGQLKSGDMLPPERSMTELYGISRPLLREALKALESMGIIDKQQGRGNFISNNISSALSKTAVLSFKLNNGNPQDILDLRYMIESYTVPKAAHMATESDIAELRKLHLDIVNESDPKKKANIDRIFHQKIAKISDNKLVINILNEASQLLDVFTAEAIRNAPFAGNSINNVYKEHNEIVEAIASHDPGRALAAIEKHLNRINIGLMSHNHD